MPFRLVLSEDEDRWVINGRLDSDDPIVRGGQTFEVPDERGRFLLARYYPLVRPE